MNAEHATSASAAAAYGSPGAAIRDARTRAGLSLEELASRTRLTRPTLEAMENDAFEQLLEPVYVRGYYRKCARILDIPDQPLVDAYDALYTPPPKPAPQRLRLASGGDLGSSPRLSARFAILAPIAAVILISVIWMLRQPSTPPEAAQSLTVLDPTLDPTLDPALGGGAPAIDTLPPGDTAILPVPTQESLPASELAPGPTEGAAPVDPAAAAAVAEPAPAPEPQPVGTQLVLAFEAISWARVEDASGKSLLSGVIAAGETQTLDGRPPYSIFLGNAPGVKVSFGGLPVDVAPFVKSNSTARFSVPVAGAN